MQQRDHVALVGPTGVGKSRIAKLATGLLAPNPWAECLLDDGREGGTGDAQAQEMSVATATIRLVPVGARGKVGGGATEGQRIDQNHRDRRRLPRSRHRKPPSVPSCCQAGHDHDRGHAERHIDSLRTHGDPISQPSGSSRSTLLEPIDTELVHLVNQTTGRVIYQSYHPSASHGLPVRTRTTTSTLMPMGVSSSEEFHVWPGSLWDPVTDAGSVVPQVMQPWSDLWLGRMRTGRLDV
jgi:energy-coupling factor transporter ATP-binding protein EcfA2